MNEQTELDEAKVSSEEHWTNKGEIRLFLWEKYAGKPDGKETIVFVHGSSMASQPTFDLHVDGRPFSSVMNWFALRGYDTWCVDMEGYGRSDKDRDDHFDISNGADDLEAAAAYIAETRGAEKAHYYGISSGALRAALFAERNPDRVDRLALDAFVWTGEGSPTLENRRKKLP
ncbi:MAG: alpha/beta fold hydrolase, partial [Rhodospirillales bacterium]|nr:alpha/beta fold hydrolase [Rhodospirillales bacterium]